MSILARIHRHVRRNIYGVAAIFFALSAGAYAVTTAPKNSVVTKSIKNGAVTTKKLKNGAVNGAKVANGSLTRADINQASLNAVRAANVTAVLVRGDGQCTAQVPFPSGVTAQHISGGCRLSFPSSVAKCGATATVGLHTSNLVLVSPRSAHTVRDPAFPKKIDVYTFADTSSTDLPFDLTLVC